MRSLDSVARVRKSLLEIPLVSCRSGCRIGAGDGTLLLRLARSLVGVGVTPKGRCLTAKILSQQNASRFNCAQLVMESVATDVFTGWSNRHRRGRDVPNLFLHQLPEPIAVCVVAADRGENELFIACSRPFAILPSLLPMLWLVAATALRGTMPP